MDVLSRLAFEAAAWARYNRIADAIRVHHDTTLHKLVEDHKAKAVELRSLPAYEWLEASTRETRRSHARIEFITRAVNVARVRAFQAYQAAIKVAS